MSIGKQRTGRILLILCITIPMTLVICIAENKYSSVMLMDAPMLETQISSTEDIWSAYRNEKLLKTPSMAHSYFDYVMNTNPEIGRFLHIPNEDITIVVRLPDLDRNGTVGK